MSAAARKPRRKPRRAAGRKPRRPALPAGIVFYVGPSAIDPATAIVAIATRRTSNGKTGDMVQTWILPAAADPLAASRAGIDRAVCGDCPRRWATGGDCYVNLAQAPLSVFRAWRRGRYPAGILADFVAAAGKPLRAGSYGDPVAVPLAAWGAAFAPGGRWTAYTHQWRNPMAAPWRGIAMASADSPADAIDAARDGWRAFLAHDDDTDAPTAIEGRRAIPCPSALGVVCAACGLCAGASARTAAAPHITIPEHGARSRGKARRR